MSTTIAPPQKPTIARAELETSRVLQAELKARINGEVRFDRTSRMLYSTDASNYQIEPVGVVIPKSLDDAIGAIELAASHGVPVLPRGGGSSLAGQTVGAALVIDFSKYLSRIIDLNVEEGTVLAEPGLNLESLNVQIKANNWMYGPDPSSSNRATIGGVIGNNSTGAHSILYGMTGDNVVSVRAALATGGVAELSQFSAEMLAAHAAADDPRGRLLRDILEFREVNRELIARDFPPHWRRSTGYSLNELLKPDGEFNPARLLVSSEGTLATVLQARLKLVRTPTKTALVLLQFAELVPAMEATSRILECDPSAVELMDRMLIDLTRAQPGYASRISFIEGDPAGILAVEFYGETEKELVAKCDALEAHLQKHKIAMQAAPLRVLDAKRQADIWKVRKDGLGLLYSIRGDYKPIPVIEDVSVPVEHLAEFVGTVQTMCEEHGTTAAYYAHASAGCLHIRPLINLKSAEGVTMMTEMADEAAEMAHRFGGVMSGEHGDGLQRSSLNEVIFGPELYQAMREFKTIFDPDGIMNPGKKVDAPPMTENLRLGPDYHPIEIKTHLDFSREGGFLAAIEMCNGAAVCRKLKAGTMCPSYMATKDENDTTRARANALRNALAGNIFEPADMTSKSTYEVMDLCLSCKACKTECPSSVDMAKLKTEFLAQYYDVHGTPLRAKLFGKIHTLSRLGSTFAPVANLALTTPLGAPVMRAVGVHPERKMSTFQRNNFVKRWKKHVRSLPPGRPTRGAVVYFHDTFATYNYPRIGMAAVELLEAAGFQVIIEERRACCGRPMLSKGLVAEARKSARRNVDLLAPHARLGIPIVGSEPSCILTLRDEYVDLLPGNADAQLVAKHAFMIDEFLAKLDADGELGINWQPGKGDDVFFHGHCHQKALIGMEPSMAMLKSAGCTASESGAGCCGMAGSFGYEAEHYDVSRKIGEERLFPAINELNSRTTVSVAGVSCRQQIDHFTGRDARHIAEVLADRIDRSRPWTPPPAPEPVPVVEPTPEAEAREDQMGIEAP
ncbi:MAG TPA: FAD-linked oxidase C-terminal domain-containing protein [Thermomicrobiales bacterium]|nr:FAD-linked oxidase C-terminal domain-containing protein [Thermomicrobiales bacterium]